MAFRHWCSLLRIANESGELAGTTRLFFLGNTPTEPDQFNDDENVSTGGNASADLESYQFPVNPSSNSIDLYLYHDQNGLGAGAPDRVIVTAHYEDTEELIATVYDGAPPSTTVSSGLHMGTVYGTDDLTANGNPAVGTIRFRLRAIRTTDNLGGGPYDLNSDQSGGRIVNTHVGYGRLVSTGLQFTPPPYPDGASQFAYGPAGDEIAQVIAQGPRLVGTRLGHENVRFRHAFGVDGSGTVFQTNDVPYEQDGRIIRPLKVRDVNFPQAGARYGAEYIQQNDSTLLDQFNLPWTKFPNAADYQFYDQYTADPTVTLGVPVLGESLYNRGEATTFDVVLSNARGEALTRAVTLALKNSAASVVDTQALSGNPKTFAHTLSAGADATADLVGKQWTVTASFPDQNQTHDADVFRVSSRLQMSPITSDETIYNRGEAPILGYTLEYARGGAYANQTNILSEVTSLTTLVEDSSSVATDGLGAVAYSYTIGSGHAAEHDDVGAGKRVRASHNGNTTVLSSPAFSVSSLYYVDLHPQKVGTLAKDDFPTEDANEHYAFVILGDVAYTWVRVTGVRKDGTEIQTTGDAVTLAISDPDGGLQDTRTSDTGVDGWTPRINVNPTAPSGDWTFDADVSFTGNTGEASHTITYISPLTSNLGAYPQTPVLVEPGKAAQVSLLTEIDDLPVTPEQQPTIRIENLDTGEVVVAETPMLNEVDDTATLNGSRYYYAFTAPLEQGRYTAITKAQLNGNGIRRNQSFRVAKNKFDPIGLTAGP